MDSLGDVIYYNMPFDFLDNFVCQLKLYGENFHPTIEPPKEDNPIVWVLWQMIVCMYGDYGTSPRGGCITDIAGAIKFLEELKGDRTNVE